MLWGRQSTKLPFSKRELVQKGQCKEIVENHQPPRPPQGLGAC